MKKLILFLFLLISISPIFANSILDGLRDTRVALPVIIVPTGSTPPTAVHLCSISDPQETLEVLVAINQTHSYIGVILMDGFSYNSFAVESVELVNQTTGETYVEYFNGISRRPSVSIPVSTLGGEWSITIYKRSIFGKGQGHAIYRGEFIVQE